MKQNAEYRASRVLQGQQEVYRWSRSTGCYRRRQTGQQRLTGEPDWGATGRAEYLGTTRVQQIQYARGAVGMETGCQSRASRVCKGQQVPGSRAGAGVLQERQTRSWCLTILCFFINYQMQLMPDSLIVLFPDITSSTGNIASADLTHIRLEQGYYLMIRYEVSVNIRFCKYMQVTPSLQRCPRT